MKIWALENIFHKHVIVNLFILYTIYIYYKHL